LLFLAACTQNDDIENIETDNSLGFSKINYKGSSRSANGTQILAFNDLQAYEDMVSQLENSVESWDDAFVDQYDYLNDEDLNAKEETLKFDDEKPLTNFEMQNNFYSLRNKYYAEEDAWLNHENLDEKTNPNNNELYNFSEAEMTLMNPEGEIKIGNKIYKYLEGGTLKILDGDFSKLVRYNNEDYTVLNEANVEYDDNSNRSNNSCDGWELTSAYDSYASGKRVYLNVSIRTFSSFHTRFKSKIISYKKRHHRWKRYRRRLKVGIQVHSFCGGYNIPSWSGYKNKRRKKLSKRMHYWNNPASLRAIRHGASVEGWYKYAGKSTGLALDW
jgi:hypothetical protein